MLRLYPHSALPSPVTDLEDLKDDLYERLLRMSLTANGPDGCWLFTGHKHPRTGQGLIKVGSRLVTAHRVALWVFHGEALEWVDLRDATVRVRHACCREPACVNWKHLELVRLPQRLAA